jgi:hypothetical protein
VAPADLDPRPFTGTQTETITDTPDAVIAEVERRYRYFRAVKVYDRFQVRPIDGAEPVDLAPPGEPLAGDSHAHLLAPLGALVQSLGYRVVARALGRDGAQGGVIVDRARSWSTASGRLTPVCASSSTSSPTRTRLAGWTTSTSPARMPRCWSTP